MPARLKVDNFPGINIKETTRFNADTTAGATVVVAESNQNIVTNDFVFFGDLGQEQTEKHSVTVSGNNLTISALLYNHKRYEQITDVLGDQVQFYRAPNVNGSVPDDSQFSTLSTPIDLDTDQLQTQYVDPTGSSDFWYKYVYWNSFTHAATSYLSDVQGVRGGDLGRYATIDDVRGEAGFLSNPNLTDAYIGKYLADACDEINGALGGYYTVPFAVPIPGTIHRIAVNLAAGYLLLNQYGTQSNDTTKDGKAKVDWANAQIAAILALETELLDQNGNSLRVNDIVSGWPDNNTVNDDETEAGGGNIFRISHIF